MPGLTTVPGQLPKQNFKICFAHFEKNFLLVTFQTELFHKDLGLTF